MGIEYELDQEAQGENTQTTGHKDVTYLISSKISGIIASKIPNLVKSIAKYIRM